MLQTIKPTRWTYVYFLVLLALLCISVIFSGSRHPLRLELQHSVFDQFNKLHPREPSGQVVIVDIDEASLEHFGQWPWPRNIMANLTRSLTEKGAKAIVFDGVFAEEDRASPLYFMEHLPKEQTALFPETIKNQEQYDYDALFAAEIKKSKIFVTAFTYGRSDRSNTKPLNKNRILARSDVKNVFLEHASFFKAAAVNLPQFSKSAAGNGSFMAKPDADGVLRRVGMIFTDKKQLYPSLSLEALRVASLGRKGTVKLAYISEEKRAEIDTNYRILIGKTAVPVERDGILYVRYRHFCNEQDMTNPALLCTAQDYISAHKFLNEETAQEAKQAVDGKIVLIGASAEGLKDLRSTALRPFRPGVEVHANVIEQILTGEYLLRPMIIEGVEASFIIVVGLVFIILAPFIGILTSVLLCSFLISLAVFGAYFVYVDYGVLVDPVYPSLSVLTIFIVSTILSYARAEAKRKQIRNAFGMYVARDVMSDLEKNPEKLKLGGENRDLTVMFTDIRKFTSISEGLSPEELIELMNEFLTGMTDIVMQHEGTVDKYIGDAMMSFWNAPRDVENHEREACLAALKMQSVLEPINEKIKAHALELGKETILLKAGIGINTGPCAVGNMGSKQRFAYSALGDAVNLASRLEGQTKFYGTNIIVGESTFKKASDLAMLELDLVRVVGRKEPARIYVLCGGTDMAQSEAFAEWKKMHMQMLDYYRTQDFKKAVWLAAECQKCTGEQWILLYDMYKKRMGVLLQEDLPKDWDGVFFARGK